jgi:hypothetical protein
MISIPNLSPLQQELCNVIWSCDTSEQLIEWFNALPARIKPVAHAMINMVMFEVVDAEFDIDNVDMSASQEILDHIQSL